MARRTVIMALMLVVVLSACAPDANPMAGTAGPAGDVAGSWAGLWHGLIAPVAFVISLFSDGVGIYEVHNNGCWYDLGWYDLGFIVGGGSSGARSARR